MTHPGVALMVMVGIGLGAFLYYMFADGNSNNGHHQYQHGGADGCPSHSSESCDPWCTSQDERTRRRKRGSVASNGKSDCTICLNELAEKESILFPCKHEFHKVCIIKWHKEGPQETRNTCPNCREGIFGSNKW